MARALGQRGDGRFSRAVAARILCAMSEATLREKLLPQARRIVVKLGTQVLTRDDGTGLDREYIDAMAGQIADLIDTGIEVTLVSSGAVGAGCAELKIDKRPRDVAELQAVAAVGQHRLMTILRDAFARRSLDVGQVLRTRSDFADRQRCVNIRNCVTHLQRLKCVPIINENDTVAVEELRFGDNDMLAALICNALRAEAMILLTVVDGLLDDKRRRIDVVDNVLEAMRMARDEKSKLGSGGMRSKLEAARLVTEAGELAVIAHGRETDVLKRILAGEALGTLLVPASRKLDSRQRWIAMTKRPAGTVTIDDGAVRAIEQRGKSLLASGISGLTGRFDRGDVLLVRCPAGREVARGLSNYSADEIRLIMGKRSNQFAKILGRRGYDEVIHRDNLVLITPDTPSDIAGA